VVRNEGYIYSSLEMMNEPRDFINHFQSDISLIFLLFLLFLKQEN